MLYDYLNVSTMQLLQNKTISSLELVEQINFFRAKDGNKNDLEHYNLLAIIREEFEEEIADLKIQVSEYKDKSGKSNTMFNLSLNEAKQVLVRESKIVRKAVIAYIEKLEKELTSQKLTNKETLLVQLFSSDAMVVASAHKELIALETAPLIEKIQEQAPKVEFYNQVADTTTSFDMQEVAAMLKLNYGRNILFRKLREASVLMEDNLPYRSHINNGYLLVVETKWMNPKTDQATATFQTRITQKGLDWLQKNQEKFRL